MGFNKQLPKWEGTTVEPPESKKEEGYIAGDRPPASWENWLRNLTYKALKELQEKAEDKNNKGQADGYASLDSKGNVPENQLGNADGMEEHGNEYHTEPFATQQELDSHKAESVTYKVLNREPLATDDETEGFKQGDVFIKEIEEEGLFDRIAYVCLSAETGDAVWKKYAEDLNIISDDPSGSPGSGTLVQGDTTAGWFGEVTTAEFGADHREIDTLLGLSAGTPQNDTEPFLKFIHDGKIKFIPKKSTRNDLSWDDINIALGGSAGGAPAEKIITVGDFQYKARFMRGAGRVIEQANGELYTDSYDDADRASIWEGVNGNWNANSENEWNTLILPLHTDSDGGGSNKNNFSHPDYAPDNVPDWASYTDEQLNVVGDGRIVWCAETRDTDTSRRVGRGGGSSRLLATTSSSATGAIYGLRLVLELL